MSQLGCSPEEPNIGNLHVLLAKKSSTLKLGTKISELGLGDHLATHRKLI